MKKMLFAAAAMIAAMTVNAQTVSFAGIVDNSAAENAQSTATAAVNVSNMTIGNDVNSAGDSYYATLIQTDATTDYGTTAFALKSASNVKLTFKDSNAAKLVAKWYSDYIQPNGKSVCLEISGLTAGEKVTLTLKKALNKETLIEGATVSSDMLASTSVELTAAASTIKVYSKNVAGTADAKWQLQSVTVGEVTAANDAEADAEFAYSVKINGQKVNAKVYNEPVIEVSSNGSAKVVINKK